LTDHDDARVELEPIPESVGQARRLVRAALEAGGAQVDADVAMLLTSEVVSNALLHARSPMILSIYVERDAIRVSVHDASPASPHLRDYSPTAGTGRGLHLVEALASHWGLNAAEDGAGKWVWFELIAERAAG
jgi:anti-sigma regulatory factor (Ser/Thr protein kinase)